MNIRYINIVQLHPIMQTISKEELIDRKHEFLDQIHKGHLFIYPTDTIYGIGCDASSDIAVSKIRQVKSRSQVPFSVIAPSIGWIHDNCEVPKQAEKWINQLPGPYTIVLRLKKNHSISKEVNPDIDTIGVRLPNHWISGLVRELNKPIITTSVNKSGDPYMTSIDNLDPEFHSKVGFIIYEGEKPGAPSQLVDIANEQMVAVQR